MADTLPSEMTDRALIEAYQATDGTPGEERVEALLAEIERRGLDL
ncbi:hypothetical protein [Sphingomonas aquatica]